MYTNEFWSSLLHYGIVLYVVQQKRQHIDTLDLTHWGQDKMDAIAQTAFSNAFSLMKMYKFWLKLHWILFLMVQLTLFQHWFR